MFTFLQFRYGKETEKEKEREKRNYIVCLFVYVRTRNSIFEIFVNYYLLILLFENY